MDEKIVDRGLSVTSDLVLDTDLQTLFETMVGSGGGRVKLGNGRGIQLDMQFHKKGPKTFEGTVEIYFLHRTAQRRFATYAYINIPNISEGGILGRYSRLVELWLCARQTCDTAFDNLCVQILDETTTGEDPYPGVEAVRQGKPE